MLFKDISWYSSHNDFLEHCFSIVLAAVMLTQLLNYGWKECAQTKLWVPYLSFPSVTILGVLSPSNSPYVTTWTKSALLVLFGFQVCLLIPKQVSFFLRVGTMLSVVPTSLGVMPPNRYSINEEKGTTEDEMVGWHHRHNGHEFE